MPEEQRVIVASHVISCEVCGLRVESETYGEGQAYTVARTHGNQRMREGWRLFLGRSRRWYCPEHGPKPGHSMDELTEGRA